MLVAPNFIKLLLMTTPHTESPNIVESKVEIDQLSQNSKTTPNCLDYNFKPLLNLPQNQRESIGIQSQSPEHHIYQESYTFR